MAKLKYPKSYKQFYKVLYTGNGNEQCSARQSHMLEGSSADAIFAYSGGKLIPAKHLSLGLTVKSLTGSKTVFFTELYYASNETIRRVDLGFEETLFKTKALVPSHIIRECNLSAGLA